MIRHVLDGQVVAAVADIHVPLCLDEVRVGDVVEACIVLVVT